MKLQDKSGQFQGLKTYLINLDSRPDRLEAAMAQGAIANLNLKKINASVAKTFDISQDLLSPRASACWDSHKRAMVEFLKSDDDFCLIAEDDFDIRDMSSLSRQIKAIDIRDFDFLQIGYLNTGFLDRVNRKMTNIESLIFLAARAILTWIPKISREYSKRLRIRRHELIPRQWVPDDIRAGAHFYLVSRHFAEKAIQLNAPAFLTADGFYMALAWDKYFRMARTRLSYVSQTNSPSSIKISSNSGHQE